MENILQKTKTICYTSKPFQTSIIKKVDRELEVDDDSTPKYKYQEQIKFLDSTISDNLAICLGFNPANASKELDTSNKRLINALQEQYSGYLLFNIYPEITETSEQVNLDDENNSQFLETLIKYVSEKYSNNDIIIFFGTSYVISENLKVFLDGALQKERLYKTTNKKNEFRHPASVGKVYLKKISVKDFVEKCYIK